MDFKAQLEDKWETFCAFNIFCTQLCWKFIPICYEFGFFFFGSIILMRSFNLLFFQWSICLLWFLNNITSHFTVHARNRAKRWKKSISADLTQKVTGLHKECDMVNVLISTNGYLLHTLTTKLEVGNKTHNSLYGFILSKGKETITHLFIFSISIESLLIFWAFTLPHNF